MTQATTDILASLAHVFRQMEREADQHEATIRELRAAADQAISNLRAIVALNDDPHIEEICNVTADLLGKGLVHDGA